MTWKPHVTVAAAIQKYNKFLRLEEIIDIYRIGIYQWLNMTNNKSCIRVYFPSQGIEYDAQPTLNNNIERSIWIAFNAIKKEKPYLRCKMVMPCLLNYLNRILGPLVVPKKLNWVKPA